MEAQQIYTIITAVAAIALLVILITLRGVLQKMTELKERRIQLPVQAAKSPSATPVLNQSESTAAPIAAPVAAAANAQGISGEILAVIAAAAYTLYGVPATAIQSVTAAQPVPLAAAVPVAAAPAPRTRSTWATAGLLDNTRPF